MTSKALPVCFVCEKTASDREFRINEKVMMPVCDECNGTGAEKCKVDELLDGLAEGLVCGCI